MGAHGIDKAEPSVPRRPPIIALMLTPMLTPPSLRRAVGNACSVLAIIGMAMLSAGEPLRVITNRTESHLAPLLAQFQRDTGIAAQAIYVDKGLLARLQAQPTEADVVITAEAENLERARTLGLLRPIVSPVVDAWPAAFRDEERAYVIISYRVRGFFVSRERVPESALPATYEDLLSERWRGKVLLRSGTHDYNVSLFCQMAETRGLEWTKRFIDGLKAQRARPPKGNDRDQVRAILDGVGDVSLGNSYYMTLMLADPQQRAWAEGVRFVFPDQQGAGSYAMRAGAALTIADRQVPAATRLIEYLISLPGQRYMAMTLHEYAILPEVPVSDANRQHLPTGTPDGRPKIVPVSLRAADRHRAEITAYLARIAFDQ